MKKLPTKGLACLLCCLCAAYSQAQVSVISPNTQLAVHLHSTDSSVQYSVVLEGRTMLLPSPLGLLTNEGDFATYLRLAGQSRSTVSHDYTLQTGKQSSMQYQANVLTCTLENKQKQLLYLVFQVSNNNIAFRYELPRWGERHSVVVQQEATGFQLPEGTTTFLSSMMTPMTGFARTAPSYESGYEADAPLSKPTRNGEGYVFPGLFRVGNQGWVLLSETGVSSQYCAAHLNVTPTHGLYSMAYPSPKQNNGFGSTGAALGLPGTTPWRTITVGTTLAPIVHTTIAWDVVEPLYAPSIPYKFGKGTWSWIVWQDASMNYADQVKYIDLAASLGYNYILIDALWDTNIGREKMKTLIAYAQSKKVDVFLWYNSNGSFNDAPQGPRNRMHTSIVRKEEMKWLQSVGVKGIKVDFLGGDKQETIRLYEDILSDANEYGLMVVFHGATLPRGWERMYPNFAGAEAVVASEMLIFSEGVRQSEAFNATLHPFIRNTVASMEYGGVLLNKYLVRSNRDRNKRLTTDGFQIATAVLFQNPIQFFGLTPNNLTDVPPYLIRFMQDVPTTWDETRLLEGYPGKYVVLARRQGTRWYVAGVNAQKEPLTIQLSLPMLAGKQVQIYYDDAALQTLHSTRTLDAKGTLEVVLQPNGGIVVTSL